MGDSLDHHFMPLSTDSHHHPPSVASAAAIRNGVVTHPYLRSLSTSHIDVRDAHDAHIVLEAVRLNILPIIRRRLLTSERDDLRSGHVYVWEEAQDDGGLLRWTDGRRWSQSRMRGDYLFYEEKVETTQEERDAKAARRAQRAADPHAILPVARRRKDRPSKPDGLTKQTYSVTVNLPGSSEPRKWHLVAYFSPSPTAPHHASYKGHLLSGASSRDLGTSLRLPPISTRNRATLPYPQRGGPTRTPSYTTEDRRILDSFRVIL
ncbi:hypothetical protein H0H93_014010 [Arthromyces matolae]|nr:hypothetical protein H0H93_014010 [Arthromyces matolae]